MSAEIAKQSVTLQIPQSPLSTLLPLYDHFNVSSVFGVLPKRVLTNSARELQVLWSKGVLMRHHLSELISLIHLRSQMKAVEFSPD